MGVLHSICAVTLTGTPALAIHQHKGQCELAAEETTNRVLQKLI